jgi:chromosome segregation ATPase
MALLSLLGELSAHAPSHVRSLAILAGIISALGVVLAVWHTVRYILATREISKSAAFDPGLEALKGPLRVLNVFRSSENPETTLSPDAVWEFVTSRLHFDFESHRAQIRFLGYLPLLIGLAATMLGLAGLIDRLGLGMSSDVRNSLRGVFLGTLVGIGGSAIVGLAGLVLSSAGRRTIAAVEDYLHARLLPAMPERRIGVRVEEAVMSVIAERSQAVIDHFRDALQPVATELSTAATQSSLAATTATEAFDHAVAVLRDSGNLRTAAKTIADKLAAVERASTHLSKAAQCALEAAAAETTARDRLIDAAAASASHTDRLADAGKSLEAGMETLAVPLREFAATAADFKTSSVRVGDELSSTREAFASLSSRIESRNELEKQRIDQLQREFEALDAPITKLHTVLSEITQEVAAARGATEVFRQQAASQLATRVDSNFDQLAGRLGDVLTPISALIPAAANQLALAASGVQSATEEAKGRLPELQAVVAPIQSSLATYVTGATELLTQLQETNGLLADAVSAIRTGAAPAQSQAPAIDDQRLLASELVKAIRELRETVATLRPVPVTAQRPVPPYAETHAPGKTTADRDEPPKTRRWWPFRSESSL